MLLRSTDQSIFCQGASNYSCRPAAPRDRLNRLFIPISIGGHKTDAVLDTGGAFLILDPVLAAELDIVDPSTALFEETIVLRGRSVSGQLYTITLTLESESDEG